MSKLWLKYEYWSKQSRVYRYMSDLYRYMLAKNDQNPNCTGTCSGCTGTCHRKLPIMCIFSHFSCTFFHRSLLLHPSSKTNMESLQTTPPNTFRQRIQRFTQFYQKFGIVKDSIFNYDQLGIFNQTSLNSRVRMCS